MPDNTDIDDNTVDERSESIAYIRQLKRTQRQTLTNSLQLEHSQLLRQNISQLRNYRNSQRIACYIANDGEIDPAPLIEHAFFLKKEVFLPILSPLKNSLYFAPYKPGQHLKLNRFSIPEPVCRPSEWITAAQLDLLLLPLVAFDNSGNRIGMGGGFYDRTLSYMQHRSHRKKPVLAGLAHEIQKVGQLQAQSWDIPLDYIVTEKQVYKA